MAKEEDDTICPTCESKRIHRAATEIASMIALGRLERKDVRTLIEHGVPKAAVDLFEERELAAQKIRGRSK